MIKEILYKLSEYIKTNRGKSIGIILGFLIAILILLIGFLKTIFIMLCVCVGYYIGDKIDNNENLKDVLNKIFMINK
ncbi:DUF2273 domain-containing protein [Schnuerera sp. xch1]|uniref:DUF2273 domain-containing protein n=1 Tax=Schnuerera sp. xch1 TaxID=2874283 RepID=UPI001CBE7BE6|nr:DUF2273 domain-containing protein [Schnuerera sp. xch1]